MNKQKTKQIAGISITVLALFTIFYLMPNVFGYFFITNEVSPIFFDNKLVGIKLMVHNSYFMPVVLSYEGADVVIDIFDENGSKVYRTTFVSEYLHDDEEGYKHIARIKPRVNTFDLEFTESSQYYMTSQLPSLAYGKYTIVGKAFGVDINSESGSESLITLSNIPR